MKKSILSLSLALLGLGTVTTSCEDMLTPDLDRYATGFSGKDTVNFYLGILSGLQGMVEQNVLLGELRGDLVAPTEYVSDSVSSIANFRNLEDGESQLLNRAAYYKVINQCNYYLAKVDSMAMKNNSYFMRRELSQVELVRAWTYMQLVQNYGRVPFITRPVESAGTGWETNPPEGWATPDNLLELLEGVEGQSLSQAYSYAESLGYINYGNFNTGAVETSHAYMTFNGDIIYGDLYLLRGESKADYEKAAYHYHRYLDRYTRYYPYHVATVNKNQMGDRVHYIGTTGWGNNYTVSSQNSITNVPSAANSFFGKVLTRIPQVYGFDPSSGVSSETTTEKDEDGKDKDVVTTSGRINVTANYKSRQVAPSAGYIALADAQSLVYNVPDPLDDTRYTDVEYLTDGYHDLRLDEAAPLVRTDVGRLRFIDKFCMSSSSSDDAISTSSFSFRYVIPVYTIRQIYLKYAEAVNRAGFPRHAFAILRDGLEPDKLPTIGSVNATKPDTVWTNLVPDDPESPLIPKEVKITNKVVADSASYNFGGANCIDLNELKRAEGIAWLDFDNFSEKPVVGIHQAGCGYSTDMDSLYSYENMVAQRIEQEYARSGQEIPDDRALIGSVEPVKGTPVTKNGEINGAKYTYTQQEDFEGYDYYGPSEAEIAAVETLIADEMALDLAFEGTRYYDLMRIARHRNNAGLDGSSWMAWLISRRDLDLAPYAEPQVTGSLYDFLSNPENWYLPAPKND